MTEPTPKPRDPMRVAIAILGVAVLVMAAIVAFLIWGRSTPTVVPAPTPSSPLVNSTPTTTTTTASPATPIAAATTTTELATTTEAPSTPIPRIIQRHRDGRDDLADADHLADADQLSRADHDVGGDGNVRALHRRGAA